MTIKQEMLVYDMWADETKSLQSLEEINASPVSKTAGLSDVFVVISPVLEPFGFFVGPTLCFFQTNCTITLHSIPKRICTGMKYL